MSVYSASKAAINGLTEALQAELNKSNVRLCIVMPATIDTPLFEHAKSKEGREVKPNPPVYPPSEVARAIEECAVKPRHHIYAGPAAQFMAISNVLAPQLNDFLLARITRPLLLKDEPKPIDGEDNLAQPMDASTETTTGGWGSQQQQALSTAGKIALGVGALLVVRKLTWARK
jgi:hypothetical protein